MPDPFRSKGYGGRRRRRFPRGDWALTDTGVLAPVSPPDYDDDDDEVEVTEPVATSEPVEPVSEPTGDENGDGEVPDPPAIYGPGSSADAWRAWMADATGTNYADWEKTSRNEIVETAFDRGLLHPTHTAVKVVLPDKYVDKDTG